MKRFFLIILIFGTVILFAQMQSPPSSLSSNEYDAWVVEYYPYKKHVMNSILKYNNMHSENMDTIRVMKVNDQLIVIRSMAEMNEIYGIWYGTYEKGYAKLNSEQVKWILGETLRKTLLDRDQYLNFDTDVAFNTRPNQSELDYLYNVNHWAINNNVLDIPNSFSLPMGNYYRFITRWGNDWMGFPQGSLGQMQFGIKYKYFELGGIFPSLLPQVNILGQNTDISLSSGFGGYGKINMETFTGYLSFSLHPVIINDSQEVILDDNVDTPSDTVSTGDDEGDTYRGYNVLGNEFTFQVNTTIPFPNEFIPFFNGTINVYPGVYSLKISKGYIGDIPEDERQSGDQLITSETIYRWLSSDYYWGFYLRLDAVGDIPPGRSFPRYLLTFQDHFGLNMMVKCIININNKIGMSITYTKSQDETLNWVKDNELYLGLILNW
ncbi:MAG: hypothetical protein ACE5D7_09785 [Fidelibacterota bacterium]